MRAFGEVLAHYRQEFEDRLSKQGRRISDRRRARMVGVTHPILKRWERGEIQNPDLPALWKLAGLYGLSFVRLITLVLANRENPKLPFVDAMEIVKRDGKEEIPPPPLGLAGGPDRRTQRQIRQTLARLTALLDVAFDEPDSGAGAGSTERDLGSPRLRK